MRSWWIRASLWFSCFLPAATAHAEPLRQYGPHVHGRGHLDLVLEGNQLVAKLTSPGADIVGFEYQPRFDEQITAVEAAVASLRDAARILGLPAAAGCGSDQVEVHSAMTPRGRDDVSQSPDKDHDYDEQQGDRETAIASHAEFRVTYRLTCASPKKVDHLAPGYFGAFERTRELRVRAVGPWGQTSATVTRDRPRLDL